MQLAVINEYWVSTVSLAKKETFLNLRENNSTQFFEDSIDELTAIVKSLGLVGPIKTLFSLKHIAKTKKQAESTKLNEVKTALNSIFDTLTNYLTYVSNGGLDRENWFISDLQIINDAHNIESPNLHYRIDMRSLRELCETAPGYEKLPEDKAQHIQRIANAKTSEWTEKLRKDPESKEAKTKFASLLNALSKVSSYAINQNTLMIYSTFLQCVDETKTSEKLATINLLEDIVAAVTGELNNEQLKFKAIRRSLLTALALIIEASEKHEIHDQFINQFKLQEPIAQYKRENTTGLFTSYLHSTNALNELKKMAGYILELPESHAEDRKYLSRIFIATYNDTMYDQIEIDVDDYKIKETLEIALDKINNALKGPKKTTEHQPINIDAMKKKRAHLYSLGQQIERTQDLKVLSKTKLIKESTGSDVFDSLYMKLVSIIQNEEVQHSSYRKVIFATAALFEFSQKAIYYNGALDNSFLKKAEGMISSFPYKQNNSQLLEPIELMKIELDWAKNNKDTNELKSVLLRYSANGDLDIEQFQKIVSEIPQNNLSMSLKSRNSVKEEQSQPLRTSSLAVDYVSETNGKSSKEEQNEYKIDHGPIKEDIYAQGHNIKAFTSNFRKAKVNETTFMKGRSLLHTLRGTAGLTYDKELILEFRMLETELADLHYNGSEQKQRIDFAYRFSKLADRFGLRIGDDNGQAAKEYRSTTTAILTNKLLSSNSESALYSLNPLSKINEIATWSQSEKTMLSELKKLSDKISLEIAGLKRGMTGEGYEQLTRIELYNEELFKTVLKTKSLNSEILSESKQLYRRAKRDMELSPQSLLSRFQRSIEAANNNGTQVRFALFDNGVRLPERMLKQITPFLEHLIRNSIDHGITNQEDRINKGKEAEATITIQFFMNGTDLTIIVEDDGNGMDFEKLYKKMNEPMPDKVNSRISKYLEYLKISGTSSLESETENSGKGIGLYSVQQFCLANNGNISIMTGDGGTKVKLSLPCQALGVKCLIVNDAEISVAIPTDYIKAVSYARPNKTAISLRQLCGFQDSNHNSYEASLTLKMGETIIGVHGIEEVEELSPTYSVVPSKSYVGFARSKSGRLVQIVRVNSLLRLLHSTSPSKLPTMATLTKKKVLIVDDSKAMRNALGKIVNDSNYEFETAYDGIDALIKLNKTQDFALVIVDLDMPRLDGLSLIDRIKSNGRLSELAVVVVTGKTSLSTKAAVSQRSVNEYFTKPFKDEEIRNTILRLMPAS